MAQLKDLIVNGSSQLIGDVTAHNVQITSLKALSSATGTTYNVGTTGQALFTNGSQIYWGTAAPTITENTVSGWGFTKNTGTITQIKTTAGKHSTITVNSGSASFNIPTNTSHLTNDSGFLTSSDIAAVMHYKGTKETINALPTTGNIVGDVWHVTANGSEYAWDGTAWQELGTVINLPSNTGSNTTGITIADHATTSLKGVAGTITVSSKKSGGNGTAPTLGTAFSVPNVTSVGTASSWVFENVTVPIRNDDATTIPNVTSVGTASTWSFTDVTVPIRADSNTTVPKAATSATACDDITAWSAGSGSFTQGTFSGGNLTMSIDSNDNKKLNIVFTAATHGTDSHTHTAPSLSYTPRSITGVSGSVTVRGVKTDTTNTASKASGANSTVPTLGTAISIYGVKSGSNSTTIASHVKSGSNGTAPTLGTAFSIPNVTSVGSASSWEFENKTVATANANATTVVTGKTHSVTDNGHTHSI